MNPIVPSPPSEPQIADKPASVVPGSLNATAVTARPHELGALMPAPELPPPRRSPRLWIALSVLVAGGAIVARFVPHGAKRAAPVANVVSGRAGLKHTRSGQTERWWRDRATVVIDGSLGSVSPTAADSIEEAFGEWVSSDARLPRLAFDVRRDAKPLVLAPDGENRVYYGPIRVPGHEGDLAITLAYTNADTGEIIEADMIFNSKEPFALLDALAGSAAQPSPSPPATPGASPGSGHDDNNNGSKGSSRGHGPHAPDSKPSGTTSAATPGAATPKAPGPPSPPPPRCADTWDLRSVATHEAGHFFGLGEDMTTPSNTMYYSTLACDVGKRVLKPDDTGEVATLYAETPEGAPAPSEDGTASVQKCSVGSLGHSAAGERSGRGAPVEALGVGLVLATLSARRRRR